MTTTATKTVTHGIAVCSESFYIAEKSEPFTDKYLFGYRISITNNSDQGVRLVSRHWIITDGIGHVNEVRGEGVVGEQPRILPGKTYEYTSFCPLRTSDGFMQGTYHMLRDDAEELAVEIGPFRLLVRYILN